METKDAEDNVTWITVNGAHVPIPEGMTAGAAIQKHFGRESKVKSRQSRSTVLTEKVAPDKLPEKIESTK